MTAATVAVVLMLTYLAVSMDQDRKALLQPVDSYICIQSETNRAPNAGCRFSRTEKP